MYLNMKQMRKEIKAQRGQDDCENGLDSESLAKHQETDNKQNRIQDKERIRHGYAGCKIQDCAQSRASAAGDSPRDEESRPPQAVDYTSDSKYDIILD